MLCDESTDIRIHEELQLQLAMDTIRKMYYLALKKERNAPMQENSQLSPYQGLLNCFRHSLSSPRLLSFLEKLVSGGTQMHSISNRQQPRLAAVLHADRGVQPAPERRRQAERFLPRLRHLPLRERAVEAHPKERWNSFPSMTPEICLSSSSLQLLLNLASVSPALLHGFHELPRYVPSLQAHTSPANSLYVSMPALLPIVALLEAFPVGAAPGVRRVLPRVQFP